MVIYENIPILGIYTQYLDAKSQGITYPQKVCVYMYVSFIALPKKLRFSTQEFESQHKGPQNTTFQLNKYFNT